MDKLLKAQRNEITEHHIYAGLARRTKDDENRRILKGIAEDELRHYEVIAGLTKREARPRRCRVWWYTLLASTLGVTFALKLMERGESVAQAVYKESRKAAVRRLVADEQRHEKELIRLLSDERVEYAGSIVLGLNDALVELSGALAGFTLALQKPQLIALTGAITGFAASLSMAASGFLSAREENEESKNPLKSALYTGVAYVVVVSLLILPYLVLKDVWVSLGTMLGMSVLIIAGYTYYIAVAKELHFRRRFLEMALISLSVAAISFGVGLLLKSVFGVDA